MRPNFKMLGSHVFQIRLERESCSWAPCVSSTEAHIKENDNKYLRHNGNQ